MAATEALGSPSTLHIHGILILGSHAHAEKCMNSCCWLYNVALVEPMAFTNDRSLELCWLRESRIHFACRKPQLQLYPTEVSQVKGWGKLTHWKYNSAFQIHQHNICRSGNGRERGENKIPYTALNSLGRLCLEYFTLSVWDSPWLSERAQTMHYNSDQSNKFSADTQMIFSIKMTQLQWAKSILMLFWLLAHP